MLLLGANISNGVSGAFSTKTKRKMIQHQQRYMSAAHYIQYNPILATFNAEKRGSQLFMQSVLVHRHF